MMLMVTLEQTRSSAAAHKRYFVFLRARENPALARNARSVGRFGRKRRYSGSWHILNTESSSSVEDMQRNAERNKNREFLKVSVAIGFGSNSLST